MCVGVLGMLETGRTIALNDGADGEATSPYDTINYAKNAYDKHPHGQTLI